MGITILIYALLLMPTFSLTKLVQPGPGVLGNRYKSMGFRLNIVPAGFYLPCS